MTRKLILGAVAACALALLWHRGGLWQRMTAGLGWCSDVFDYMVHPEDWREVGDYYC